MSDDKVIATKFDREAGGAASHVAVSHVAANHGASAAFKQASRRAVGVYERPARRARLSLPLVVILILSALVSIVATARFLF